MTPTATYTAFVAAVDRRIRSLRWTMEDCDDRSGNQSGFTAKMLHPETASGRQARWETVDFLMQALFPGGFKITITPLNQKLHALARTKFDNPTPPRRAMYVPTPDQAREMARKRWDRTPKERRSGPAKKAIRARWSRPRIVEVVDPVERKLITRALTPSQSRVP